MEALAAETVVSAAGVTFNPEINLGHVINLLIVIGGVWLWSSKLFGKLLVLETRLSSVEDKFDRVGDILERLARYDEKFKGSDDRCGSMDRRMDRLEQAIIELRHGEGFVFPDPFARKTSK